MIINPEVLGLLSLFVLLCSLVVIFFLRRRHRTEHQLKKVLLPYIKNEIRQVVIPDGIGGLIEIEQLILLDNGLFIVQTYNTDGNIFGGEAIDQWTQIVRGRSFKFANPLRHIMSSKQALSSLVPGVPIFYRVIFVGDVQFPKGTPDGVSTLHSLAEDLTFLNDKVMNNSKVTFAWERIMRIARKDGYAAKLR